MEGFPQDKLQILIDYVQSLQSAKTPIITAETLNRLPDKVIRGINARIHQHYNPITKTSRVKWNNIMFEMHCVVGEKSEVFDLGLFQLVCQTYDTFKVTHEMDDTKNKHFVVFELI